jgi:RNA polymerase sigma-70 factor, ECF subfamily
VGDRVAFNQLVIRHQDAVYTLCYRLTGSPEDAADATQEAFLSAFRHISELRGEGAAGWLLRIASNACHDLHRYRKRRPASSLDAPPDSGEDAPSRDVADESPGPEGEALRGELSDLLQAGLLELPDDQRLALVLCDQHGYDYQAIAGITGAELGTVKSRINRARRKMRDFLRQHRELLPGRYRLSEDG